MKSLYFSLLFCITFLGLQAQTPAALYCDGTRYLTEVFTAYDKTTVVYGQNTTYTGQNQSLNMDIYQPVGDQATMRPLIVFVHGGSFIGGSKTDQDMTYFGEHFAKQGFVVASINYRLGLNIFSADSIEVMKAVVRAVHDLKASVRYFRKSVVTEGNPYKIDTMNIFIGGSSAGAITSLHTAYLTQNEAPAYLNTILANMGGDEGNSGNPGYSSRVHGVLNGSGALGDKEWMNTGDVPLVSVHGTADDVVPYGTALQYLPGFPIPVTEVDGSGSLHPYALSIGINSTLKTFVDGGHVPYLGNQAYMDTTMEYFTNYLVERVCGATAVAPALPLNAVKVYPNPTEGVFRVESEMRNHTIAILDITGKKVWENTYSEGSHTVSLAALPKGLYFMNFTSEGGQFTQKIILQ
ncbi:MAG: T9SS type A sorting domain-containing protein [Bacteroidia bacterium]|nr:T9SS type A sorting domain-containing protein [Bacteroidia bacterium]